MWMAKESGGFAKEGLDVEMISMSSVLALPALIANEVDVIQVSAVPVITASLRGFDVVFISGMLNTMVWDLYARPEIKTAEHLRGKIVGTERPGTPVAYGTLVALRKLGLTPKDVQLRIMGGTIQIAASLQTNQIAAGALGSTGKFPTRARRLSLPGNHGGPALSKRRPRDSEKPHGGTRAAPGAAVARRAQRH